MSIIKVTCLSFWLLGCCLSPWAQPGYSIQRFTTDNGLPSNGIKGLQWDEQTGFLWIATEAGIARYNGTNFQVFNRTNTPRIFSERMRFLLKTFDGRIYTSDEAGNLFFVEKNGLQSIGKVKLDTRSSIFKLTGLIASSRLFRQSSLQVPSEFGFDFIREQLVPLSENRLLMTHKDTLFNYRLGSPDPSFIMTLGKDVKLFYLNRSLFLFDPAHGCYRLDPDTPRMIPVPLEGMKDDKIKAQLFWDNGMRAPILVKGPDAWILEWLGEKLVPRLICTGLPIDDLFYFMQYDSSSGLLFAGTQSKGIRVIRKQTVQPVRTIRNDPDVNTAFYSQVGLPGGDILMNDGQILGKNLHPSMPPMLDHAFNNFSLLESDSTLWYSQAGIMRSYSFRTQRMTAAITGTGSIQQGFVRSEGKLYVADAAGVGLLIGEHIEYQYLYPQSNAPDNVPNAMTEISPGLIAIATCKCLLRFNTITHRVDTVLRLPGICVRALWKYKGYLFVGTYGRGIWLYKDGIIRSIPLDKNGYLQYAHCFVPDRLDYCWISTNRGLFRARPDDMTAAFEDPARTVYYHYYGLEDGMTMTELNGGCSPCALMLNDTTLSFPSMDGLIWVDPTRPIPVSPQGQVFIDGFWADSQRIKLGPAQPMLPPDTRDLRFDLAFPAWRSKENLYIDYKLEPWSHDWQALDLQHGPELQFGNLPHGHYRLLVRNSDGFGPSDSPRELSSFYILPHWFQEPLSWVLGFILLCALVIVIVRLRTRQFQYRQRRLEQKIAEKTGELQTKNEELEKANLIKTRLISIISHDLITPLHYLHLAGRNLIEKNDDLTEGMQEATIAEMTATSKELELLSTNILNWMKYHNEDRRLARENFDLHEQVAQLFAVLGAQARQKGILLVNAIPKGFGVYQFIEPVRIVLYNLILNSLNFTSKGSIRVGAEPVHDGILLQISDTGVGMTQEQINHIMADHFIISSANVDNRKGNGLGYMIIKDLLKILRGSLSIHSGKEKGTTVTVWITR